MTTSNTVLGREIRRRRTFAIISHPDAGKTTLTEKLLLFGGALREAGAVRAQKATRYATSDWLEIEKQRGISISSSVMHFEHEGFRVNILDTPGHRDFSEDTFRTLMAADSAVMLIDAAKGVEPQTRKLFEVCRLRRIPIFTFVNKMDRFGRDPLELMDEIETVLGIEAVPVNWPLGSGNDFRGVYDRISDRVLLFSGGAHGTQRAEQRVIEGPPSGEAVRSEIGEIATDTLDSLELLEGAGASFDPERVRAGLQTPMFFGSALTNYGVEPFLERFLDLAPHPSSRVSDEGPIEPDQDAFSGFVFKMQANMDPDHRDRVAFVRICSGRFERGATVKHVRSGKPIRLASSTLLMGKDRAEVEEAWPGDVVGLFDPGVFQIGDTISATGTFSFPAIPSFSPEHFVRIDVAGVVKRKALEKGLEQLVQEGAIQLFSEPGAGSAAYVLGAMGPLQFEVLTHRLATEYDVPLKLVPLPYTSARWPQGDFDPEPFRYVDTVKLLEDREGRPVLLFKTQWNLDSTLQRNPDLELSETADPSLFSFDVGSAG